MPIEPGPEDAEDLPGLEAADGIPNELDLAVLVEITSLEAPEHDHPRCTTCESKSPVTYLCDDCQSLAHTCAECTVKRHAVHPFHRLRRWDSEAPNPYFKRVMLGDLDYEFCLGHDGLPCPASDHGERSTTVTFVDVHGVFKLVVRFCICPQNLYPAGEDLRGTKSYHNQLLRHRLYPASKLIPRFAYTFRLLKHFHRCNLSSKTAAYDYCEALKRLTDPVAPQEVSVSLLTPFSF